MELIYEIPGKLTVYWDENVLTIVDVWNNYYIRIDEFQQAVMVKGLDHAKANGGLAWVVDSSDAEGKFSENILNYIGEDVFPTFVKNGIKYFITIKPVHSPVAAFNVTSYSMKTAAAGLKLIEMPDLDSALAWLKEHQ